MAYLYKEPKSDKWYIKIKNPATGKWEAQATPYVRGNPTHDKLARMRLDKTRDEERKSRTFEQSERWGVWVDGYLERTYTNEGTKGTYGVDWVWLNSYLHEKGIVVPRQVKAAHGYDLFEWRLIHGSKEKINRNTAKKTLKLFKLLMTHAVKVGMAEFNPLLNLGIKGQEVKEKEEFSDEDISTIYANLKPRDITNWKYVAFQIALYTGCRISETRLPIADIHFEDEHPYIYFDKPKGSREKAYSVPMEEPLKPLFMELKKSGATWTHQKNPKVSSQEFGHFLEKIGFKTEAKNLTFHGLRVTRASRLKRAGVSERDAMLLLNHSSETVHRVYQRNRSEELRQHLGKVLFPKPPVDKKEFLKRTKKRKRTV